MLRGAQIIGRRLGVGFWEALADERDPAAPEGRLFGTTGVQGEKPGGFGSTGR